MPAFAETQDRPRVLILGATGMLGHRLMRESAGRFQTIATVRSAEVPDSVSAHLSPDNVVTSVAVGDEQALERAFATAEPDAVVNCIGMVKQRPEANDAAALIAANSLFPHQVEAACARHAARLVQVSTDCVFSGSRGGYSEEDRPDPIDLYGRSKLAGEPEGAPTLTLRTSMIGRELDRASGLLEWFLSQEGQVSGFPNAIFSGPTTPVLSRLICDLIATQPQLRGLIHVAAEPISKLALLELVRDRFGLPTQIEPDPSVRIDRSLKYERLREATGWQAPAWEGMISELAEESSNADR